MKIRLHGTEEECRERLCEVMTVVSVSAPCPDRGASVLFRVYVECRFDGPTPARKRSGASPPGDAQ